MGKFIPIIIAALASLAAASGHAQPAVPSPHVQSAAEALRQDAVEYATAHAVVVETGEQRLAVQDASLPVTDALATEFADRLAGIAIDHGADYRIDILLTGDAPVAPRSIAAAGLVVPIVFHTGAVVTRAQIVAAILREQAAIRATLLQPPAFGVDQRTGHLVAIVGRRDVDREGAGPLRRRIAAQTGMPVTLRTVERTSLDTAAEGGARVVGINPDDGRRYACTAGFVVTDGTRTAIATAAHCPDALDYVDGDGRHQPLAFVGQWGWGYQDVQINLSAEPLAPLFLANTPKSLARFVTGRRSLAGTRAGDYVCHRGERTGYSCAEVELTDFAPAGDLCGGACSPTWVTVAGPNCKAGDSGAPVFSGNRAYGIVKGGSYRGDGSCAFYFYMSTDYLPTGWALLAAPPQPPAIPSAPCDRDCLPPSIAAEEASGSAPLSLTDPIIP